MFDFFYEPPNPFYLSVEKPTPPPPQWVVDYYLLKEDGAPK